MTQLVSIGRSLSGAWGLFTGGFMAWPLTLEDVLFFEGNDIAVHEYCRRRGFEWTGEWSSRL